MPALRDFVVVPIGPIHIVNHGAGAPGASRPAGRGVAVDVRLAQHWRGTATGSPCIGAGCLAPFNNVRAMAEEVAREVGAAKRLTHNPAFV
jgi:hypothetical protein